jgi:alpha-N-arabinofuranosidase
VGIVQRNIWVRKGERLEVDLWALAQNEPVELEIGLRPAKVMLAPYAAGKLTVDAPYWKNYRLALSAPADDDAAEFFVRILKSGMVFFDQIHLRPEGTLLRADVVEAVRRLAPPVLRFPGGCISTAYRWRNSIGPVELRPTTHDPIFKGRIFYDFGTDEYLELCHDLNITPHITVAVGSGTPQEAADWAAYCAAWFGRRGIDPPRMYWQIGNEQYGQWELGHSSPAIYAQVVRDYVPGIRQAYPNCRIIAQGQSSCSSVFPDRNNWREVVIRDAGDVPDVLSLQLYGAARNWPEDPQQFLDKLHEEVESKKTIVAEAIAAAQAMKNPKTIAITEWNFWTDSTHHDGVFIEPPDGAHLMYVAGIQNNYFRAGPTLELASFYNMLNPMGVIQARGATVHFTGIAELLRMYRQALPGRFVPLETGTAQVDAVCWENERGRWLFINNWSTGDTKHLDVEALGTALEQQTIHAASLFSPALADQPRKTGQRIDLPPLSVTRVKLSPP